MDFLAKVKVISGALKEPGNIVYGSYHFPEFTVEDASRNTLERFDQFDIPKDLSGKTVLDLGSNTGAMSLEFARRGATVVGVEFNPERVEFCNKLTEYLKLNASFYCCDLNHGLPIEGKFDIVSCMSIDAYLDDRFKLYQIVAERTKEVCYFESNYPSAGSKDIVSEVEDVKKVFCQYFSYVNYIGQSTVGGRRIFKFSNQYFFLPRCTEYWHRKKFNSYDDWIKVATILSNLKFSEIPDYELDKPNFISCKINNNAITYDKLDFKNKPLMLSYKNQIIDFIVKLNKKGYAHRDLHLFNLLFENEKLYVIDWEWVTENPVSLLDSYDLTGKG